MTWLQKFGRASAIDAVDWSDVGPTMGALCDRWMERPEEFVDYLTSLAMPAGGWAIYGAHMTAWEVLTEPPRNDQYIELFRAAMAFAQSEDIELRMGEVALLRALESSDGEVDKSGLEVDDDFRDVIERAHLYAAACKGVVDTANACVETANLAVGARNMAEQPSQHRASAQVFAGQAARYDEQFIPLYKAFIAACSAARDTAMHFRQAALGQGHDPELVLIRAVDNEVYEQASVASHILRADFGPTPSGFVDGLKSADVAIQGDIFAYGEDGFVGHVYEPSAVSTTTTERVCPWCAETIKAAAIICRFCGRDVGAPTESLSSSDEIDRAHELEGRGDIAEAESMLRAAVESGHQDGLLALGSFLKRNGEYAGAEAAWLEGERRGDMRCTCNLAVLLETQGDAAAAEAAYRRADAAGFAAGSYGLGQVLYARGDLEGAMEANRRADALGDADAAYNLGVLLQQRDDIPEAEAAFQRADERGSGAGSTALGRRYEDRGMAAEAEAAYRRAADRGEGSGAFNLGALLFPQGRAAEARAAFIRAATLGYDGAAQLVARIDAESQ